MASSDHTQKTIHAPWVGGQRPLDDAHRLLQQRAGVAAACCCCGGVAP